MKKINQFALIIGAMKSGTTALFSLMEQHPEISGCKVKEPGFFIWDNYITKTLDDYYALWDFEPIKHKYALEASTSYTKLPTHGNLARLIKKSGINAKFIYVMRHPIRRIESYIKMANITNYKFFTNKGQFIPLMYSLYHYQITEYYKLFPSENILLLQFEEFAENPSVVLQKVNNFLEIDTKFQYDFSRMNKHDSKIYKNNKIENTIDTLLSSSEKEKMIDTIKIDMKYLEKDFGFDTSRWEI